MWRRVHHAVPRVVEADQLVAVAISPLRTIARITAFSPGQSPPPVRMPDSHAPQGRRRPARQRLPAVPPRRMRSRGVGLRQRPVPWRRLLREWALYVGVMVRRLRRSFRDRRRSASFVGLLVSGRCTSASAQCWPSSATRARRCASSAPSEAAGPPSRSPTAARRGPRPSRRRRGAPSTGPRNAVDPTKKRAMTPSAVRRWRIDAGTTGVRSRAVFVDGRPSLGSYREFTQHFPRAGLGRARRRRRSGEAAARRRSATSSSRSARRRRAIGITNQRETVVAWDRATGRAVRTGDRLAGPSHRGRAATSSSAAATSRSSASAPASCSIRTSRRRSSSGCSPSGVPRRRSTSRSARSTRGCCGTSPAARCTPPIRRTPAARCCSTSAALSGAPSCCDLLRRAARRRCRGAAVERAVRRHLRPLRRARRASP